MHVLRDEDFDPETGLLRRMPILQDQETLKVPMRFMDSSTTRPTGKMLHRPGFVDSAGVEAKALDAVEQAHTEYRHWLVNAWRGTDADNSNQLSGAGSHGPIGAQAGDQCTIDGAPGHLHRIGGRLICIPDPTRPTSARPAQRNDAQDIGTLQATHDAIMREEYSRFDQALQWKHV